MARRTGIVSGMKDKVNNRYKNAQSDFLEEKNRILKDNVDNKSSVPPKIAINSARAEIANSLVNDDPDALKMSVNKFNQASPGVKITNITQTGNDMYEFTDSTGNTYTKTKKELAEFGNQMSTSSLFTPAKKPVEKPPKTYKNPKIDEDNMVAMLDPILQDNMYKKDIEGNQVLTNEAKRYMRRIRLKAIRNIKKYRETGTDPLTGAVREIAKEDINYNLDDAIKANNKLSLKRQKNLPVINGKINRQLEKKHNRLLAQEQDNYEQIKKAMEKKMALASQFNVGDFSTLEFLYLYHRLDQKEFVRKAVKAKLPDEDKYKEYMSKLEANRPNQIR